MTSTDDDDDDDEEYTPSHQFVRKMSACRRCDALCAVQCYAV